MDHDRDIKDLPPKQKLAQAGEWADSSIMIISQNLLRRSLNVKQKVRFRNAFPIVADRHPPALLHRRAVSSAICRGAPPRMWTNASAAVRRRVGGALLP